VSNKNNSITENILGDKTSSFAGFALYIQGTSNEYNQIQGNNLRNWAQHGTGVLTTDGTTAAALAGSSTTIASFSAIGTGSVAGFNMV